MAVPAGGVDPQTHNAAQVVMSHPGVAGTAAVTQEAFDTVWSGLGWVIVGGGS